MRTVLTIACAALAAVAGCGDGDEPLELAQPSRVALAISYDGGTGDSQTAEIHCGERPAASGYESRSAARLCRDVRRLARFLTGKPAGDRVCAEIYGGPQTARIEGEIEGRRVDREFRRTDACQIDDWRRIESLLPTNESD